jgi:hypothetical protein
MVEYKTCEICKKSVPCSEAINISPRQMASLQVKGADISAPVLHAFAVSIIVYDNPPASADRAMWWICKHCLSSVFAPGDYSKTIRQAQVNKQVLEQLPSKTKNWWKFWK